MPHDPILLPCELCELCVGDIDPCDPPLGFPPPPPPPLPPLPPGPAAATPTARPAANTLRMNVFMIWLRLSFQSGLVARPNCWSEIAGDVLRVFLPSPQRGGETIAQGGSPGLRWGIM